MSRPITMIPKDNDRVFETLNLIARQRLARVVISGCEMTHDPVDAHVAKLRECVDEVSQLIEANAQSSHSRVDFDMNVCDNSLVRRGLVQRFEHVETINNGS